MWVAALPCASTPLWQLTQLPITPAWDIAAVGAPVAVPTVAIPTAVLPSAPGPIVDLKKGSATRAPPRAAADTVGVTTVPMVLRDAVLAGTVFFAPPPLQLFVLWQPLPSLPV